MAKFPSQKIMTYDLTGIDDASMSGVGFLNIPKDLSILNRRGYASTTRKGVPLVYRCRVTYQLGDDLGRRAYDDGDGTTAYPADMMSTLKIVGCQNNWVLRNAAVKFHAAREKMFEKAGVEKAHRGAYSHEIRYGFDSVSQTWMTPIDGDGAAFTGGTWDLSDMTTEDDASFGLRLVGSGVDESAAISVSSLTIGHSYLQSRATVPADSNLEASGPPAKFSVLHDLLDDSGISPSYKDDIMSEAQDAQDNPPYDEFVSSDLNNDVTESVELGRAVVSLARPTASVIVDIPFGLAAFRASVDLDGSSTDEPNGLAQVQILKISEMQG